MNCPRCGNFLPQGAQFCNVCNEPVNPNSYIPYGQPGQSYPQMPSEYPQGYSQSQQSQGYPSAGGYQQGYPGQAGYPSYPNQTTQQYEQPQAGYYSGYNQAPKTSEVILAAILKIPRMFKAVFRNPDALLKEMVESQDVYSAPIVVILALVLAFLSGVVISTGAVSVFLSILGGLYGQALANRDGINSIAGSISNMVGGISLLYQFFAMAAPLTVMLVYICVVRKMRFSLPLGCGLITVMTLPTLATAPLAMVGSLLSPVLPVLFITAGVVVSYVFMGNLVARVLGVAEADIVKEKIILILTSMVLNAAAFALVTSLFSGNAVGAVLGRIGIR